MRVIAIKEIFSEVEWHPESILPDFPFQQAYWYGEMQKRRGRNVKRFVISKDAVIVGYVQFVVYPLLGFLKYWYAAYGPVTKNADDEIFRKIKSEICAQDAVFVRLDFTPTLSSELFKSAGRIFTKSPKASSSGSYFQPRHEWYTDISGTADEILSTMHQKTRYSVRYAEKKGVKTEIILGDRLLSHLQVFLSLMKDTAKRNRFSLHDDNYYQCFFEEVAKRNNGFLVEAKLGEEILALHFVVVEGGVAHYAFGGTADQKKELCAPYLAHFAGMLEAKKRGAKEYNFGGISEAGDAPHWAGVTAFKKRFGGRVVSHSSYFDIVLKPFWYYLYIIRKFFKQFI